MANANFNRRIYQTQGLFVGPSPSTGAHFAGNLNTGVNLLSGLSRIISMSPSFSLNRADITEFGQLAPISREITDAPNVGLSFTYYATDGINEKNIGFVTSGSNSSGALTNILNGNSDDHNYFIPTVIEGIDLVGQTGNATIVDVRGIGNGFLSSYSVEGSVGGFLTASVNVEAFNAKYDVGTQTDTVTGNYIPAINLTGGYLDNVWVYQIPAYTTGSVGQTTVFKQGDLTLDLSTVNNIGMTLTGVAAAHIQRFSISVPFNLQVLQQLGNKFGYAKLPNFPINVTMNISAYLNNLTSGSLSTLFCADNEYTLNVYARSQTCTATPGTNILVYTLKGARMDSQSSNLSIGPAETSDIVFTTTIGGPSDNVHNFYISGQNP